MKFLTVFLLSGMILLSGCATPVYKEVFREKDSYNSREFPVPQNALYQATTLWGHLKSGSSKTRRGKSLLNTSISRLN